MSYEADAIILKPVICSSPTKSAIPQLCALQRWKKWLSIIPHEEAECIAA